MMLRDEYANQDNMQRIRSGDNKIANELDNQ
jgi:hypothetical protein